MNKIIINGHLTDDMQVVVNKKGTTGYFFIANNIKYKDFEKTNFIKCVTFNEGLINALEEYLVKGCKVLVEGEISIEEYEENYYTSIIIKGIEIEKFKDKVEGTKKNNRRKK